MTSSQALWALFAIFCVQGVTGGAVLLLGRQQPLLSRCLPFFVSGAAGVLLATACLDLLPEAVQAARGPLIWEILLITLVLLFCLEALAQNTESAAYFADSDELGPLLPTDSPLQEQHGHGHQHLSSRTGAGAISLLLGSALHSSIDGIAIGAAFAAGSRPGWSAAIAVALHELPHRLGDFSVLLHRGMSRRRAAQVAIGTGAAAFAGGLGVMGLGHHAHAMDWLLPVSAASFLYIALVDLVPELHAHRRSRRAWWEIACLIGGAALIAAVIHLPGE